MDHLNNLTIKIDMLIIIKYIILILIIHMYREIHNHQLYKSSIDYTRL